MSDQSEVLGYCVHVAMVFLYIFEIYELCIIYEKCVCIFFFSGVVKWIKYTNINSLIIFSVN